MVWIYVVLNEGVSRLLAIFHITRRYKCQIVDSSSSIDQKCISGLAVETCIWMIYMWSAFFRLFLLYIISTKKEDDEMKVQWFSWIKRKLWRSCVLFLFRRVICSQVLWVICNSWKKFKENVVILKDYCYDNGRLWYLEEKCCTWAWKFTMTFFRYVLFLNKIDVFFKKKGKQTVFIKMWANILMLGLILKLPFRLDSFTF